MFELRKDIPVPAGPVYPWATMEVGDCLVFDNEADFKAAAKSARAQVAVRFICKDQKIWLVERAKRNGPAERLLSLLDCENGLTEGVIINRMRRFSKKEIMESLNKLVENGAVTASATTHRFNGRPVFRYKKAA